MKKLFITVLIMLSQAIYAEGRADLFEVDLVRVDKTGLGYVKFKNDLLGTPADCIQPGYEAALAFDTNQAAGKSIMSLVLAAQASGRKVLARGTGSCAIYGVMEEWKWGYVQ